MIILRACLFAVCVTLAVAGCSTSDKDDAAPAADPSASNTSTTTTPKTSAARTSTSSAAAPSTTPHTGFCLDLTTFQVGVVMFQGEAGDALDNKPLDFVELRRKAAVIAQLGKEMRASAPPDIARQFHTVLTAVATSASHLKQGASVRDVVFPLYGKANRAAFDAVDKYECR